MKLNYGTHMKRNLIIVSSTLFGVFLGYSIIAFTQWKLDPSQWNELGRLFSSLFSIFLGAIACSIAYNETSPDK